MGKSEAQLQMEARVAAHMEGFQRGIGEGLSKAMIVCNANGRRELFGFARFAGGECLDAFEQGNAKRGIVL